MKRYVDMFMGRARKDLDVQHEDAIRAGLPHRPYIHRYRGYVIDSINFMRKNIGGDRTYQVNVTAWDKDEEQWELVWEVQTGLVDGGIAAIYWLAQ